MELHKALSLLIGMGHAVDGQLLESVRYELEQVAKEMFYVNM